MGLVGQEDTSHALALRTLLGPPWRGTADLIHLFHPPQERMSRKWGSVAGRELYKRYLAVGNNDPTAMRSLISEIPDEPDPTAEPAGLDHSPISVGDA